MSPSSFQTHMDERKWMKTEPVPENTYRINLSIRFISFLGSGGGYGMTMSYQFHLVSLFAVPRESTTGTYSALTIRQRHKEVFGSAVNQDPKT